MVVTDSGIAEIQKFIRDDSGSVPNYITVGSDTDAIVGDELPTDLDAEFLRKQVTWAASGANSKYVVQLSSTEANGSYINRIGLTTGSAIGSDLLFTLNQSIIGEKNASFNVQIEGEIIIKR